MRHLLLPPFLATAALAQATWVQQLPTTPPSARSQAAATFDPVSQQVFLFGGRTQSTPQTYSHELFVWDGNGWQDAWPNGPYPLDRGNCGFCAYGGGLLLFGGFWPGWPVSGTPNVLGDTWVMQNWQWTQVASTGPVARERPQLVATPQGALLFAGNTLFGAELGDTWLWNGSTWAQQTTGPNPPARSMHAMTFDPLRGVAVLFGGRRTQALPFQLGDTWEWSGGTWVQRFPAHSPTARYLHGMAFSPTTGRVVITGGVTLQGYTGVALDDTWSWDGTDWTQVTTTATAPPRNDMAFAFGPGATGAVRFGGNSPTVADVGETFVLVDRQADVTSFGSGCAGPGGLAPSLAAAPGTAPRLGTTLQLRVGNLPPPLTIPVLVYGFSDSVNSGAVPYPLPFDLGVLGWQGCMQLVSIDSMDAAIALTPAFDFALPIPLRAELSGFTVFAQAFVLYQPTGAAVSNALHLVVGA